MNTQLATTPTTALTEVVEEKTLVDYLDAMGLSKRLTAPEKTQFLQIAQAYGLNPFKREIYVTKYGENADSFSIITGYEVYLKRAERTGKLDGWEVEYRGAGEELSCVVTIFRKDWSRPLRHEAFYSESVQKTKDGRVTKFWQKAKTMTRKVAISQGFRLAFPDELGGMPYTNDELGVQDTTHEVIADSPSQSTAHEAKVTTPQPVQAYAEPPADKMSKREIADAAAALTAWQNDFDTIETTPEAYLAHGQKLQSLKGLSKDDMKLQFKALCNVASKRGIDWSKEDKAFYWNPDAVDTTSGEVFEPETIEAV